MNRERLLQRFLRYVQIDTEANPDATKYPSSDGQFELGKVIVGELQAIGLADIRHDEHGLVYATVPARGRPTAPVIAFNAHLDTSHDLSGKNVKPQVIRNYRGGDIQLPALESAVIRVSENPELEELIGKTLVTTDGTTLLGADDKAGLAVIVELAAHLMESPDVPHGPVKLLFTCDEEIGRGTDHVDLDALGAVACYTLDGAGANEIDVETFSADSATVTVIGKNIHPSIAKGRMVNALRGAGEFLARLPRGMAPETTSDRQGFIHPNVVSGDVEKVVIKLILRDFETAQLARQRDLLKETADEIEAKLPGVKFEIDTAPSYRNLGEGLALEPRAVAYAEEAHRRLGREPKKTIIRGGTDGSQFTAKGLPTPNLSTGEHNPHSRLEWTCLEEMEQAVEVCREIVRRWAE